MSDLLSSPVRRARLWLLGASLALLACKGDRISDPDLTGYNMSIAPSLVTVGRGGTGTSTITISRTALVDRVLLSLGNVPEGVTGSFEPAEVDGTTSELTINVAATVPTGTYELTVFGAASSGQQESSLTLTVTNGGTGGGSIAVVEAGTSHTCAIKASGQAYCWGLNVFGQLGDGTNTDRSRPVLINGVGVYTSITAGYLHSCGVTTGGFAYCWGGNPNGALGDGTNVPRTSPTLISGGLSFASLSATGNPGRTCGVTTAGTAYCWGDNPAGEIGDGTILNRFVPTLVTGGLFGSVSAGAFNTCGVRPNGAAFCWGINSYGQVGDGRSFDGTYDWLNPTAVTGGHTFAKISAGDIHTCGVTTAGIGYCWGDNTHGELGDGTIVIRGVPTLVSGGILFSSIRAGNVHSCGIATDGRGYCWGFNGSGQLGDGTLISRLTPTLVSGGLRFTSISPSDSHTCGLTTTGTVYCWGNNASGQIGDGSAVNRPTPTAVSFP